MAVSATGRTVALLASQYLQLDEREFQGPRGFFVNMTGRPAHLAIDEEIESGRAVIACSDARGEIFTGDGMRMGLARLGGIGPLAFLAIDHAPGIVAPFLIAGARDGKIALQAPDPLLLSGHSAAIRTARFSADFTLLASGSDDGTARLWRFADGANLVLPTGAPVLHVAFAANEPVLVTLSADGVARRWRFDEFAMPRRKAS
jgi:hypothetical protein